MSSDAEEPRVSEAPILIADFFEATPPNQEVVVSDVAASRQGESGKYITAINCPELRLHCPEETCNGVRFFRCISKAVGIGYDSWSYAFITYRCSNCQITRKTYAIAAKRNYREDDEEDDNRGQCLKLGEVPPYGPPLPSRLIKLIGPDRDLFLRGRRCENQGLGIGAFVYYRRVVEDQKNRILSEIIKVAQKIGVEDSAIDLLRSAQAETQFSKALEIAKQVLPQSLLINGHNPLSLLHTALSEGLHGQSDEECLELAASVRIVLAELSERLGVALKDEAELNNALSKLLNRRPKADG